MKFIRMQILDYKRGYVNFPEPCNLVVGEFFKPNTMKKEEIFVNKKNGRMFLLKKGVLKLDIENPVERDLDQWVGQNRAFIMYEKR